MSKIAEKGTEAEKWLTNEQGRFVPPSHFLNLRTRDSKLTFRSPLRLFSLRLAKLISSPALAPTKTDEIKIKLNILSSFLTKKAAAVAGGMKETFDAVKEEVQDAWGGVKQEL